MINKGTKGMKIMKMAGGGVCALAVLLAASFPLEAQKKAAAAAPVVRSISRTALPQGERIVIELTSEVRYAGERIENPDRVYFDLERAAVPAPVAASTQTLEPGALVKAVRVGRHSATTSRVVLELAGHPRYSAFPMYNPFRLVIDVETQPTATPSATPPPDASPIARRPPVELASSEPATVAKVSLPVTLDSPSTDALKTAALPAPAAEARPTTASRTASTPPPLKTVPLPASVLSRGGDYSLARQLGLGVARVVIDPGHGGHDPGAQSNGIVEAELVLDIALRVEKLLQDQPGVDVVLTRRTNEFIPLEERTAIANREGADLFLSIHANASKRTVARGIETYFLNFSTNPEAEAVAARENASSGKTMGNLPDLVKTIALNNKVLESRELASIIQTSMVRRLRQQNKTLRDLGVKQAPFVVLIGAQMPSVLAEISFVTNKAEAALLKQSTYRQRIAQSLVDGVLKYQGSLEKATTVAAKTQ